MSRNEQQLTQDELQVIVRQLKEEKLKLEIKIEKLNAENHDLLQCRIQPLVDGAIGIDKNLLASQQEMIINLKRAVATYRKQLETSEAHLVSQASGFHGREQELIRERDDARRERDDAKQQAVIAQPIAVEKKIADLQLALANKEKECASNRDKLQSALLSEHATNQRLQALMKKIDQLKTVGAQQKADLEAVIEAHKKAHKLDIASLEDFARKTQPTLDSLKAENDVLKMRYIGKIHSLEEQMVQKNFEIECLRNTRRQQELPLSSAPAVCGFFGPTSRPTYGLTFPDVRCHPPGNFIVSSGS